MTVTIDTNPIGYVVPPISKFFELILIRHCVSGKPYHNYWGSCFLVYFACMKITKLQSSCLFLISFLLKVTLFAQTVMLKVIDTTLAIFSAPGKIYNIFVCVLLLLVGAVFIYTPGDIAATGIFGFDGAPTSVSTWVIYGVIFAYYLIATVFPIDAIIGRIYPIFGAILMFSALGVFIGLFAKGYPLMNIWDDWNGAIFAYGDYFGENHFIPIFFVTVACGILSGFHSTQTAIISRTMKSERQGRMTFYNMMVLEGFIAMVWAAAAMGIFNLGLQEATATPTSTVIAVCRDILGPVGSIIALAGVVVLPVTSGDTALRGLRLTLSETLHIDQTSNAKRLSLAVPVFALVAVILVFAKFNSDGFNILWRYFAWSNQTLALFAFLCISVWMFENGKAKFVWIPLIPGAFYTFICSTYIANAAIGFNLPWAIAYPIGAVLTVAYVGVIIWYGKKRSTQLRKA